MRTDLAAVLPRLPQGVSTVLGPDATALGWVYQYALVDESGTNTLAGLRSVQDWYLRHYLKSVPGVAEVAPIGGFVRQYQVQVDPNKLRAYNVTLGELFAAVAQSNSAVGGENVSERCSGRRSRKPSAQSRT